MKEFNFQELGKELKKKLLGDSKRVYNAVMIDDASYVDICYITNKINGAKLNPDMFSNMEYKEGNFYKFKNLNRGIYIMHDMYKQPIGIVVHLYS